MMPELCVCALVPVVEARTRVVVVAHARELAKPTNTGRFLARGLAGARLVVRADLEPAAPARAAILFPSEGAAPLDPDSPPSVLYVPDGTYKQARRMLRRVPALVDLPHVALPPTVRAVGHLRRGVEPFQLSTYEAVARALGILEGPEVTAPMLEFIEIFVKRTLWFRGLLPADAVPGGITADARRAQGIGAAVPSQS